mmetsp:Transcript_22861/g.62005  ORF Transcript_22861/g.62005 Transcript_22861/m.62005 type:complete len:250 (-) Transcript_22861:1238-1987(-)
MRVHVHPPLRSGARLPGVEEFAHGHHHRGPVLVHAPRLGGCRGQPHRHLAQLPHPRVRHHGPPCHVPQRDSHRLVRRLRVPLPVPTHAHGRRRGRRQPQGAGEHRVPRRGPVWRGCGQDRRRVVQLGARPSGIPPRRRLCPRDQRARKAVRGEPQAAGVPPAQQARQGVRDAMGAPHRHGRRALLGGALVQSDLRPLGAGRLQRPCLRGLHHQPHVHRQQLPQPLHRRGLGEHRRGGRARGPRLHARPP